MMKFSDFDLSKTGDGLLPVVVQDASTSKVLMLGYMNEEAFNQSIKLGRLTFWSRGRKQLWLKGETSGNFLEIVEMYPDCDADTLLVRVNPIGPVCHRGTTSCFDTPESEGFLKKLEKTIQQRHKEMPDGSYTTKLFIKGVKAISKKVGEEAAETIIEAVDGNRNRFIYEASDLLYHLLVLMEQQNVSLSDVEKELLSRH